MLYIAINCTVTSRRIGFDERRVSRLMGGEEKEVMRTVRSIRHRSPVWSPVWVSLRFRIQFGHPDVYLFFVSGYGAEVIK